MRVQVQVLTRKFEQFRETIEQKVAKDIGELRTILIDGLRLAATASAEPVLTVADLDTRFQWLVDAVSERLVTLGNGLARIERQLDDEYVDGDEEDAPAYANLQRVVPTPWPPEARP